MRIAEYKQTGTRTEQQTVHHPAEYDEFGEIIRDPIAEYKQTGTRTEQQTVHHPAEYDEFGEIIRDPWDEVVDVEVPVMGVVGCGLPGYDPGGNQRI